MSDLNNQTLLMQKYMIGAKLKEPTWEAVSGGVPDMTSKSSSSLADSYQSITIVRNGVEEESKTNLSQQPQQQQTHQSPSSTYPHETLASSITVSTAQASPPILNQVSNSLQGKNEKESSNHDKISKENNGKDSLSSTSPANLLNLPPADSIKLPKHGNSPVFTAGSAIITVNEVGQTKLSLNHEKELDLIKQENIKAGNQSIPAATIKRNSANRGTASSTTTAAENGVIEAEKNQKIDSELSEARGQQSVRSALKDNAAEAMTLKRQNQADNELVNQPNKVDQTLKDPNANVTTNEIHMLGSYNSTNKYKANMLDRGVSGIDRRKDPLLGRLSENGEEEDDIEDEIFEGEFNIKNCCANNATRATKFLKWLSGHWKNILRLILLCVFLTLAVYYSSACESNTDVNNTKCIVGGVHTWEWFVVASIWIIAWPVSEMILFLIILLASQSLRRITKSNQQVKDATLSVAILYYLPSMNWHLSMLSSFAIATLSFYTGLSPNILLVQSEYPQNNQTVTTPTLSPSSQSTAKIENTSIWTKVYPQLLNILALITVYYLGRALSKCLTLMISQEFNIRTYGEKANSIIRTELMLFKLLGGVPYESDKFMYRMIENTDFVKNDPRVYNAMTRSLRHRPFRLLLSQGETDELINVNKGISSFLHRSVEYNIEVSMDSSRVAELMGRICFRCIWAHAQMAKIDAESLKKEEIQVSAAASQEKGFHSFFLTIDNGKPTPSIGYERKDFKKMQSDLTNLTTPTAARAIPKPQSSLALAMMSKNATSTIDRSVRRKQRITKDDIEHILAAPDPPIFESILQNLADVSRETKKQQEHLLNFKVNDVWNFLDVEKLGYCEKRHVGAAFAKFYEERKNLADTLADARNVVRTLENMISAVINFFVILCGLAIWGLNVMQMWVSISSIILAFTFVFSSSASNAFSALVFVFSTHAYDVGDLVRIGDDWYKVLKIYILNTTMQRWDGSQVKFNNTELSTSPIFNLRTSGLHSYYFTVSLDIDFINPHILDAIRKEFGEFVASDKENLSGEYEINLEGIIPPLKAVIYFWVECTFTESVRTKALPIGSKVIARICTILTKFRARYSGVALGIFSLDSLTKVSSADRAQAYLDGMIKARVKADERSKSNSTTISSKYQLNPFQ